MSESEPMCMICIEPFTKQPNKKRAQCPYCNVSACVKCTQTYLLETTDDPHCMECRKAWTRETMDTILLTTWLNGEFKKHRENILLDRERARLPAAQLIIERRKRAEEYYPEREQLHEEIVELLKQVEEKERRMHEIDTIIRIYNAGQDPFENSNTKELIERRTFIMPCPAKECRGFLSSVYKCGVCDVRVCPDCREVKGHDREVEHTCDPNTVETVRAIKKETRPCPECGTNIFKIDGCNSMFCTNCKCPFDWKSGKKITHGAIHNPHYFEYIRAANGGVMPRDPGDIQCGTHLPNAWTFEREVIRRFHGLAASDTDWLFQALRQITHIQHVDIPSLINRAEDMDNTDHNIRYLRKEIDEVQWKRILQQREKRRVKRDDMRMRLEAFVAACIDMYRPIMEQARPVNDTTTYNAAAIPEIKKEMAKRLKTAREQLDALREIFNGGMMTLSKRYKCRVMQLSEKALAREFKKFDSGRMKRVKQGDSSTVDDEDDGDVEETTQPA
jgi:hypothetical protein